MAKSTPITTNIMSFKTFRSPDKISHTDKEESFIYPSDLTSSYFNNCPVPHEEPQERIWLEYLEGFNASVSYKEIRDINPEFYDYSCLLMQPNKSDEIITQLKTRIPNPLENSVITNIWDELFYQVAAKKSNTVRQASIQMLITQHYIVNKDSMELTDVAKLTILIPEQIIKCFKRWVFGDCGGELFGVHNLGVQDYRRVEQTLCCYVPGEVSHIENVMAKEYKEKSTRNLLRTEYTTELTSETEIENLSDTTSTERNEISSEVAKELQKDKSFNVSGSVTVSKDSKVFGAISANASTGYTSNNASSLSNTEAKNYAKEVTERALERIVQKTTERRTYKMIKEFEENNKHGFDNREGINHVTGVYRWVDKIYDNQLVNYGRRLLFEVSVPSPADFYKKAMLWKSKDEETAATALTPPKTLAEFGLNSGEDVTNESIIAISDEYGLTIDSYTPEVKFIDVSFGAETDHYHATKSDVQSAIMIDPGFVADRIDGVGSFQHRGNVNTKAYLKLNIGNVEVYRGDYNSGSKRTDNFTISKDLSPDILGSLSFVVTYRKVFTYSGSFKVKCVSDPALYKEWQEDVYQQLKAAYQAELDKYNQELELQQAASEAEADQEGNENYSNAAMNRLIEERELKRLCIEMMSKPYCYDMGQSFNECKTYSCESECGEVENQVSEVTQNKALEKYAEFIKFFETAFQWEIFSYIFYPYYYNSKCQWSELLQTKSDDPIFEAFLQSGMSKVLVPVRPQYEKAVMWYLETGEIYTDDNLVPEFEDDRYASLLKDLQNQDELSVEGSWKTRVPSSLTIIQAKSSYLEDENGLPCCDEDGSIFGSNDNTLDSAQSV